MQTPLSLPGWHKISVKFELWHNYNAADARCWSSVWCVFASRRDESELVRFGDRLGGDGDGVIPSVTSQNRNRREGELERESARACVSVIVTSSDPPSARPRGAAGGREGVVGLTETTRPASSLSWLERGTPLVKFLQNELLWLQTAKRQMSCVPAVWCIRARRERAVTLGLLELHKISFWNALS